MPMAEIKTKVTTASVTDFINAMPDERKRVDSFELLKLFKTVTKEKPKMWGTSMIGFGLYHYKSERSSQEGDWPLIAFSPRKQNLTLYIMTGLAHENELLKKLGKHKKSVSCLYIKTLDDVNKSVLKTLIQKSFREMKKQMSK
jgi:hypothetical protein